MHILILIAAAVAFLLVLEHSHLSARVDAVEAKLAALFSDAKDDAAQVAVKL